jgi:hypothetical protein
MRKTKIALVLAGAGTALSMTVPAAAQAAVAQPAARSCTHWQDSNTYGYACKGYPSGYTVQAFAGCVNGKTVHGKEVSASKSSYTWSYAYCTSVNSSLLSGWYVIAG